MAAVGRELDDTRKHSLVQTTWAIDDNTHFLSYAIMSLLPRNSAAKRPLKLTWVSCSPRFFARRWDYSFAESMPRDRTADLAFGALYRLIATAVRTVNAGPCRVIIHVAVYVYMQPVMGLLVLCFGGTYRLILALAAAYLAGYMGMKKTRRAEILRRVRVLERSSAQ